LSFRIVFNLGKKYTVIGSQRAKHTATIVANNENEAF